MAKNAMASTLRKLARYGLSYVHIKLLPKQWMRRAGVRVGEGCRFYAIKPGTFGSEPFLITIGNRVTVTDGVRFVTHDGALWVFRNKHPNADLFDEIRIGSDVFIGLNAIILPGTVIGDGSIVAAGAVARGNYPPGSIIGGVPARVIGTAEEYWARICGRVVFHIQGATGDGRRKLIEEAVRGRQ